MSEQTEAKLRAVLAARAGTVRVGDHKEGLARRIATLRRRRRRLAMSGGALAIVVLASVLVPVLGSSRHSGTTTTAATRAAAPARPEVLRSQLVRDTRPEVPASAVADLTRANTITALDLYHQLASTPGNVFFSPYSISNALGMAVAGARGATLSQMLAVLHDTLPAAQFQDATNALNLALLAPRAGFGAGTGGQPLKLELANSVWGQTGFPIEPGFLDVLSRDYGAALNTLDFTRNPAGAANAINAWVSAHTNHKIRKLFAALDPSTLLVLVNAVHFKASWLQPFSATATRNAPFATVDGRTVSVPFMHGVVSSRAAAGNDYQAVDLPYIGDASMTVIVPSPGHFEQFDRSLDPTELAHIIGSLSPSDVTLAMPKLQLKDQSDLVPLLERLGMTDAFSNADFSGISHDGLSISQVVHQATVTVDEQGTEAAAATGISFASAAENPVALTVDRPYLFLIRDDKTGTILFLGRVTDPTQTQVQQP